MTRKPYIFLALLFCGIIISCSHSRDAQALYEQGKALREAGRQVEAMQCFMDATHSGTTDEALLGRIYSNMANMCRQANEHETAYEVYVLSANHFAASGDTLAYAYALNNMAWEQAVLGRKDSALALIEQALSIYPREPLIGKVRESRAAACLFAQEYDSVLFWTAPPFNDYLQTLRAQAFSFLQMDDSATYYAQTLLPRTTNLFALDDLYYILTHNDETVDKETVQTLSSQRADVQKAIENRRVALIQAVQLMEREKNQKEQIGLILLALLAALMAIGLSVWALFLFRKHRLWHNEQAEQERLRRNERLHTIKLLCDAPDLRTELAWNDYTELCRRTDKLFQGLAGYLQTQGMNEQDIRICILALLGLTHKQMAEMLHCSPKSIGKLKDITARKLSVSGGNLHDKLLDLTLS